MTAEQKFGAIPLSTDLMQKANIGQWAFELDEGAPPRMYVDDIMLGLIGLDHQVSPEETYHAWYDNIDEGSYGLVADAVDKMMTAHAEVQYPWHHPDGRTFIVRCGGVRNPAYTRGIRIEGCHQNVTDVLHYQEEEIVKKLDEKYYKLIEYISGDYLVIIDVEIATGNEIHYKDVGHFKTLKTTLSSNSFYPRAAEFVENAIIEEDRPAYLALLSPESLSAVKKSGEVILRSRAVIEGKPEWIETRFIPAPENPDTHVIYSIRIVTREQEKKEKFARRLAISDYFLKSFVTSYYLEIPTGSTILLHADDSVRKIVEEKMTTYDEFLTWYVENAVHPDDREKVRAAISRENLKAELAKSPDYSFTFRDNSDMLPGIFRCTVIRGENADHAAMGFKVITEEVRAEQALQETLKAAEESRNFLENFAKRYQLVFSANMKDGSFAIIKAGESLDASKYSFADMQEAGDFFISRVVYPPDREMLSREMEFATVRKRLEKTPTYGVEFRMVKDGVAVWNEMSVTSMGGDEIAVGFINRDAEILNNHINEILMRDSEGVYVVNLDTDQMKIIKATEEMKESPQVVTYSAVMRKFASFFSGDAKKHFEEYADLAHCKDMHKRFGKIEYVYPAPSHKGERAGKRPNPTS